MSGRRITARILILLAITVLTVGCRGEKEDNFFRRALGCYIGEDGARFDVKADPGFNLADHSSVCILPRGNCPDPVLETELLWTLRGLFEQKGYTVINDIRKEANASTVFAWIEFSQSEEQEYRPPRTAVVPRYVPGEEITITDERGFYGGSIKLPDRWERQTITTDAGGWRAEPVLKIGLFIEDLQKGPLGVPHFRGVALARGAGDPAVLGGVGLAYMTATGLPACATSPAQTWAGAAFAILSPDGPSLYPVAIVPGDTIAAKAGLRCGDIVTQIDGRDTKGWSFPETMRALRSHELAPKTLRVRRGNSDVTLQVAPALSPSFPASRGGDSAPAAR